MRPSIHQTAMITAEVWALRATCARRGVGAVITSATNQVLGIGYNGPARTLPHCVDKPCPGARFPSGEGIDFCQAVHAEQNALVNTSDMTRAHNIYVTTAPCVSCVKLLLNTPIKHIYYRVTYADAVTSRALWITDKMRTWTQLHD